MWVVCVWLGSQIGQLSLCCSCKESQVVNESSHCFEFFFIDFCAELAWDFVCTLCVYNIRKRAFGACSLKNTQINSHSSTEFPDKFLLLTDTAELTDLIREVLEKMKSGFGTLMREHLYQSCLTECPFFFVNRKNSIEELSELESRFWSAF